MLTMDQIHDIRLSYFEKGKSIAEISKEFGKDRKTVRKYLDMEDFNQPLPKPANKQRFCPKLEPYKPFIDAWLEGDKIAPRKQRHTAKHIFNRLRKEVKGFNCSYRTVATYFKARRKEVFIGKQDGFLPLEHRPGEAQVDFGTAQFYEYGECITGKYLEVSFPYSNKGYMQLFYGENLECLLEGLDRIFRHIGCVPTELWFDNAKAIVTEIIRGGKRTLTEKFKRFQEHYGFKAVFMNPGEGHEKGNVENKVGYQRRNFLVPVPHFDSLEEYNLYLLNLCEEDGNRDHYRFDEQINDRFQEDIKASRALPTVAFDLSGHEYQKANKWGKIYLNKGMHEYSVSPKYAESYVNIKLTSSLVIMQDENYTEIVRHKRLYGDQKQQQMDWLPYLKQLSVRPRALKYTGVYELMPTVMKEYLDSCSQTDVGQILKLLSELTARTGFESALATVNQAVQYQASDTDSLKNLYHRLYSDTPELPPMQLRHGIPKLKQMPANLERYDALLSQKGKREYA